MGYEAKWSSLLISHRIKYLHRLVVVSMENKILLFGGTYYQRTYVLNEEADLVSDFSSD